MTLIDWFLFDMNTGLTFSFILLKNGKTYFEKLALFTPQDF